MPRSNDDIDSLEFDTIHSSLNPPSGVGIRRHEEIHPSEALAFQTQPYHITGQDGAIPHPSESLSFSTVHDSLRMGRGAPFGSPREQEKELAWSFKDILAQGPDESRRSSVAFSPISPSTTTSKFGSKHLEWARRMSGASSAKSNAQITEDDKNTKSSPQHRLGGIHPINDAVSRLHTLPHVNFAQSKSANHQEHAMTLRQGLRSHPKAMLWSLMLSCTLIMEGFDLSLINGFYAFPPFRRKYGHLQPNGTHEISTAWQQSLINGAVVGEIMGLVFNGFFCERLGYKKCLIYALLLLCGGIFLAFFSVHIWMLMASEIICGLSWGVFQTLSTTYAAEVMPMALRAYLTANVNLCWLIGQVIGLSVLRGTLHWDSQWSYRLPFGLQWMWAVPILILTFFAPESPWWLVRRERVDDAKHSLGRLLTKGTSEQKDEIIALMQHTNAIEKELSAGTTYWDLVKTPSDRYRTEIVVAVWIIQVTCGGPMSGYSAYFFLQAGLSPSLSYDLSAAMYGLAIFAHLLALFLMRYVGRRKLYMFGLLAMSLTLFIMGAVACSASANTQTGAWVIGGLNVLVTFWYDLTIGPVCYTLVSEIPSTRLRVKTVAVGRIAYNVVSIIANLIMPQMLNPTAWALKGKASFLWAITAALSLVWCYWRLPEPQGLTYMELDILFQKRAGARKFREVRVCLEENGYFELVDEKNNTQHLHWEGAGR